MKYRNKVTGVTFDSDLAFEGDDWELVKPTETKKKTAPRKKQPKQEEKDDA